MEIERINENTIKLYISYLDIEDLGFKREEIWYDRERIEQLFWQMIEEVHKKEDDFAFEGPLWIQIQALENGIEVIVTKSNLLNDAQDDLSQQEEIESILGKGFLERLEGSGNNDKEFKSLVSFSDFEHIIQFSSSYTDEIESFEDTLYHYKDKYYLQLEFKEDLYDRDEFEDFMSHLLEYAEGSEISIHLLKEYGTTIFEKDALENIKAYFSP